MSRKTLVWGGMIIGSSLGGLLPYLWGNYNFFSFSSVILTAIGGIIGVWLGWKIAG